MTAAAEALRERLGEFTPRVLLTLGSGLGGLAEEIADPLEILSADIGLPGPTVPGHAGRLLAGRLSGVPVLVQQGRVHLYEGVDVSDVVAAVRAAAEVGVERFVVTNAAGGLAAELSPGDLLLITDHLNLTGASPLIGWAPPRRRGEPGGRPSRPSPHGRDVAPGEDDVGGPVFLDMKDAYDPVLRAAAHEAAAAVGEPLVEGVYAGLVGPAFETPAEVTMLRTLGADAVGMSTVVEVIAARAIGLRVVGFSLVTNVHRPGGTPTDHEEVLAAGRDAGPRLAAVLRQLLPAL